MSDCILSQVLHGGQNPLLKNLWRKMLRFSQGVIKMNRSTEKKTAKVEQFGDNVAEVRLS